MTETLTPEWYDAAMTAPDALAMLPLEESPWLPMYEALAAMIPPEEEVVDLGCGTGRFIALLRRRGHYAKITGIDWSSAALQEAFEYVDVQGTGEPSFRHEDLTCWEPDAERAGNTVYVCSEVLEHLDDDVDLVRRIPPGYRLLLTVPNFPSASHMRIFPSAGDLWERYSPLLIFLSWRMVGAERHGIHVVETVRRTDAW